MRGPERTQQVKQLHQHRLQHLAPQRRNDADDVLPPLRKAGLIIADPLYKPICPTSAAFVPLPHIAFSGRLYEKRIPNLIEAPSFAEFVQKILRTLRQNDV